MSKYDFLWLWKIFSFINTHYVYFSEKFLYFNDDIALLRPICLQDFYTDKVGYKLYLEPSITPYGKKKKYDIKCPTECERFLFWNGVYVTRKKINGWCELVPYYTKLIKSVALSAIGKRCASYSWHKPTDGFFSQEILPKLE